MKKAIILIISALSLSIASFAVHQNDPALRFDRNCWDFGHISEAAGKIGFTFRFTNRQTSPIVIERVLSTCGCTVPSYSKEPIGPNQKGFVTLTFNPKGLSSEVSKSVTVICNSGRSVNTLTIKGTIGLDHHLEQEFPYKLSNTVYADKLTLVYDQIQQKSKPKMLVVKLHNRSSHAVQLSCTLSNRSRCLTVYIPRTLAANTSAEIKITALAPHGFYGSFQDKIILSVNSKKCPAIQAFGTVIDDMRKVSLITGPKFKSSQNYYNLGKIKANKKLTLSAHITNVGAQPLIIRKVEYKGGVTSDLTNIQTLRKGESKNIVFTIMPLAVQSLDASVKFVTNDPGSPVHVVMFEATVIK